MTAMVQAYSKFTDFDIGLFRSGKHFKLYEKFGSHELVHNQVRGTYFSVWAPNASAVAVGGNFNGWNRESHQLFPRWDASGIWEGFIPDVLNGEIYKYFIRTSQGELLERGDPFAFQWEEPPATASRIQSTWYEWSDGDWMNKRHEVNGLNRPVSVYEMHLGSWMRNPDEPGRFLTYREIAE